MANSAFGGVGQEATGEPFDFVAFVTPPGLAYAAPETLVELGLPLGRRRVLRTDEWAGNAASARLGTALAPSALVMDIGAAQRLLRRRRNPAHRLLLDAESLSREGPAARRLT